MTELRINSDSPKTRAQLFLEYIALALCLCAVALRTTVTEGLTAQSANQAIGVSEGIYSLSVSVLLMLVFAVWLILGGCSRRFLYRITGMEIGLCVFIIAAAVAASSAADKRVAVTDFVTFAGPLFAAVLLVQILDCKSKVKIILAVVAAMGVVNFWQCAEQFFFSNQMTIEQYEQAPESVLGPLGIRAGTFAQWLFEHRLYSRGVRGFFTTGNSAASFAILAFFAAVALFLEKLKGLKSGSSDYGGVVGGGLAAAVILAGFFITRSKGAIAALLAAVVMFVCYLYAGQWLKRHRRAVLLGCLLPALAGVFVVVWYGLAHGRLPGGNSMLVRWQYWCASVRMYAEHCFRGVGGGNFAYFYPHYKPAAALETVADAHNFVLSVLTQYGPAGLVGFLAVLFVPLWKATLGSDESPLPRQRPAEKVSGKTAVSLAILISAALLIVRPLMMPFAAGGDIGVVIYVIFTLYVVPVIIFLICFLFLSAGPAPKEDAGRDPGLAALFCACVGVVLHNLLDFAIFEPGVFTGLCVMLACMIALDNQRKGRQQIMPAPKGLMRIVMTAAPVMLIWVCISCAFVPVVRSGYKISKARRAWLNGQFQYAHSLLADAAEDDRLSTAALKMNGRMYMQEFESYSSRGLLLGAQGCFVTASERNRADYKNFEQLAEIYSLLAQNSASPSNFGWLSKGFVSATAAVERYPGRGRLRIKLAEIAEALGRADVAVESYKKAVEIEDAFRLQFRQMYPDREVFSRLGEQEYENTKKRIEKLSLSAEP